jgi:ribose transport system permease protein
MSSTRVARLVASGGIVWLVVAAITVYASIASDTFRTSDNLTNLSRQMIVLGLASLGQYVVVLAGGVDLSIGSNVRVAAIVGAMVMDASDGRFVIGVICGLAVAALIGLVNGVLSVSLRVEPFIATLGTGAVVGGLALYLADRSTNRASPFWTDLYTSEIGPVPVFVIIAAVIFGLVWLQLSRMRWGRHIYAVGGNADVARLSGVRSTRVAISAYAAGGLLAGCAGLMMLGRTGMGDATAASSLAFESLAVVVIGGASLAGGRGRFVGLVGGIVLFGMLTNVFNLSKVDVWYQELVRGAVILVSAALYVQRRTVSARRGSAPGVATSSPRRSLVTSTPSNSNSSSNSNSGD